MNKPEYEILLVEDDPGDAELTVLALREAAFAHRVVLARDGAEALDLLFCRGGASNRRTWYCWISNCRGSAAMMCSGPSSPTSAPGPFR